MSMAVCSSNLVDAVVCGRHLLGVGLVALMTKLHVFLTIDD